MRWFKKVSFLFLALLLPIAIFIFLKSFGENEFAVPPLFREVVDGPVECKSFVYKSPYTIHDSVLSHVGWIKNDSIAVLVFDDAVLKNQHEKSVQVNRIFTEFPPEKFHIVYLSEKYDVEKTKPSGNKLIIFKAVHELFFTYRNCVFLLKPSDNVVMVDSKMRIRGQYDLTDLEDADRLIMEMKIILKKY